jgi:hypothetical protein
MDPEHRLDVARTSFDQRSKLRLPRGLLKDELARDAGIDGQDDFGRQRGWSNPREDPASP